MRQHVTTSELHEFRARLLTPEEVLTVSRHIASCRECAAFAQASVDVEMVENELRAQLLESVSEGPGSGGQRDSVAASRPQALGSSLTFWMAAAAVLAIVASLTFFVSLRPPRPGSDEKPPPVVAVPNVTSPPQRSTVTVGPPEPVGYGNARWDTLVAEARRSGKLPVAPVLAELRVGPDMFRGRNEETTANNVYPAGEVVEGTRPDFTWPATKGAQYVVSIYSGDEEVARSSRLRRPSWTPTRELRRDTVYTWQIEVIVDGQVANILPAPPAPPALFRIADLKASRELDDARRLFPDDHFLLAVLYAKHGIISRAEAELRLK